MLTRYFNRMRFIYILLLILISQNIKAQLWEVPADKKDKTSSFEFNASTQKSGEDVFMKSCVACHGTPGKGNFNKTLVPTPPDPASEKMQNQTDGDIFYKLTTGKGLMPSFKNVLSESDRWNIVSYFRSFNKTYKQPPLSVPVDSTKIKSVHVFTNYNTKTGKIEIFVKSYLKTDTLVLKNMQVLLFSQRYFGILQIDSTRLTNNDGFVAFSFPKDLPGDKDGNVKFVIKISDEIYGEIQKELELKIGIPTNKPSLTEKRAMWNELSKAPLWLIISYVSVVVGIWLFLLFIITRILKINKLGKKKD